MIGLQLVDLGASFKIPGSGASRFPCEMFRKNQATIPIYTSGDRQLLAYSHHSYGPSVSDPCVQIRQVLVIERDSTDRGCPAGIYVREHDVWHA
jgi:hypothetical protein